MLICWILLFIFVFKQKTAYEMRISDWSSDVCSSDLVGQVQSLLEFLGFFEGFVDRANHVESLLGQCIAFAVDNHLEAAQGFSQRNVFAGRTRKDFGQVERLRKEALVFT